MLIYFAYDGNSIWSFLSWSTKQSTEQIEISEKGGTSARKSFKKKVTLQLIEVAGLLSSCYKYGKPLACSQFYATTHLE